MLSLGIEFGVKDKEKEGFLERIAGMVTGGFLELVLPEETTVSGRKLKLDSVPSASLGGAGNQGSGLEGTGNLVSRILVGEYNIRFFQGFQKEMGEGEFYELEYLIHGGNQDRDNLAGVVSHLIALRQGLNPVSYTHLDVYKRQAGSILQQAHRLPGRDWYRYINLHLIVIIVYRGDDDLSLIHI